MAASTQAQTLNFIDGCLVPAQDGEWMDNVSPVTGQVSGLLARSKQADAERAIDVAYAAHKERRWSSVPVEERAEILLRAASKLESEIERFARMESEDTGKPLKLTRTVDIPRAIKNLRFFAQLVLTSTSEAVMSEVQKALHYSVRKPVGVVGMITPWNLPLYLLSWKVAPALVMGNTIVAKPSEMTPQTATALAVLLHECGVPKGVFNVIHGLGAECGAPICSSKRVSAVSFTGGTATGEIVARAAAPSFKKLSLELGGKNPAVVFDDCDFEKTIKGVIRSGFFNQGQVCLCGSRLLVQDGIFDRFVDRLKEEIASLKVGDPNEEDTDVGALISFQHRDKVESYIKMAKDDGVTVHGGDRVSPGGLDGAFLRPTVIVAKKDSSTYWQEEIFGPVVTVLPFSTEEEAIALANGVRYGLAASVWTENVGRAHRMGQRLEAGLVWVNCWLVRDLRTPFGGMKDSGVGREGGKLSLDFYSEATTITISVE
uniref:Aldehyde dehydrogenase domain-containing protein n=1 Tax=Palpitomonas bilix TaxID=652834 RepID=A0A7S3CVQ0_9EUKA|mmetsp:Transcript_1130/g.2448  ORF Transcript_1130/g.2448 Transcript_1130/m.2448 type:complete len:487 (+) Transcript_1130:82-1542(+)